MPKIRNIIIFGAIAVIIILIYIFFFRSSTPEPDLIPSPSGTPISAVAGAADPIAQDFLTLLLSVTNIKLDDTIFSDSSFASLIDSSIILTPDGNEGRPNPFAPLGNDSTILPANSPNANTTQSNISLPPTSVINSPDAVPVTP